MAKAIGRDVDSKSAKLRRFANDSARAVLSDAAFGRNREVFCLTNGDFSLIDWIDALLDYTGPANAVISTWTAAGADTNRIDTWLQNCRLTTCQWLVDRSFINRQPVLCNDLRARFGDETIRVYASHAKFVTLETRDGWRIVSMSSANLNHNPRIESFHALDDRELFDGFATVVSSVFTSQKPGDGFGENHKKSIPNKTLRNESIWEKATLSGIRSSSRIPLK